MNAILSGESKPAPIYQHWQNKYALEAVDSLKDLLGSETDLILLAQPRAMDPADLGDLDQWVRAGGNVDHYDRPHAGMAFAFSDGRQPAAADSWTAFAFARSLGAWN